MSLVSSFRRLALYISIVAVSLFMAFAPITANAQSSAPRLLPACATSVYGDCRACDFIGFGLNGAEFILYVISSVVVLMFVLGGVYMLASGGNQNMVARGKQIITGAVIGLILVMTGYLIVNFTIKSLVGTSVGAGSSIDFNRTFVFGNTDWSEYCADDIIELVDVRQTSCIGQPDGTLCSVSGECRGEACACQNEVCGDAGNASRDLRDGADGGGDGGDDFVGPVLSDCQSAVREVRPDAIDIGCVESSDSCLAGGGFVFGSDGEQCTGGTPTCCFSVPAP